MIKLKQSENHLLRIKYVMIKLKQSENHFITFGIRI
jgi:hypothetical protein